MSDLISSRMDAAKYGEREKYSNKKICLISARLLFEPVIFFHTIEYFDYLNSITSTCNRTLSDEIHQITG